jgi:predicted peptidase
MLRPAQLLLLCCCLSMVQENLFSQNTNSAQNMEPAQLFEPLEYAGESGKVLRYRLLKPLDGNSSQRYPLVIFLHGAGERGDDNVSQLKHAMAEFCKPERRRSYPCYVLAPQCPKEERWADIDWTKKAVEFPNRASDSLQLVFEVVDNLLADVNVDRDRIYITGLSMGGYGSWDAMARRPDFFAAAMPICGGGDPATAARIKHIPIACFHGGADEVVIPEKSRAIVEAIKAAGGAPLYTEYPGVGHDSWTQTYANEENFRWLFQQRRMPTSSSEKEVGAR